MAPPNRPLWTPAFTSSDRSPYAWVSNAAADRLGLISFGEGLPDLTDVRALIGREPEVFEEFDVE